MEQLVSTGRAENCEQLLAYQLPESAAQVPELREVSGAFSRHLSAHQNGLFFITEPSPNFRD